MKDRIILDLCGGTGSWSKPYKDAGYKVYNITLPQYDVRTYEPPENVYGILAAPPCTHFSGSGAQYWGSKDADGRTNKALEIIDACLRIIKEIKPTFWALENPVGRLPKLRGNELGDVKLKFNPNDYGDPWTKKTYVWGNFNLPLKNPIVLNEQQKLECKLNTRKHPPVPDDYKVDSQMTSIQIRRSITPQGFARAFFEANQ